MEIKEQLEIIKKGTVEIISEEELVTKLKKGRPLRIKYGADPSAPDLHLGHTVPLEKLKEFQELGHEIIFIIGDFTACIGDPSGQIEVRKPLSKEEVLRNSKTYQKQVFKILEAKKTKVMYNSEWCSKLQFADVIQLASKYTVARMLERDDFTKRYREGKPISMHEFLYPLVQAYDSVMLKADIEIGGTDQKFNFLVARDFQREYEQEPQVIITMPILEGTDGVQKMSKSLGNYIGINENPKEIYGKIMSISDKLMLKYIELLTDISSVEIKSIKNPRDLKKRLAREIITLYYDKETSLSAEKEFENIHQFKKLPHKIPELVLKEDSIWIVKLLVLSKTASSNSEARRLIEQGGVKIDNQRIESQEFNLSLEQEHILKVGKRKFLKIIKRKDKKWIEKG